MSNIVKCFDVVSSVVDEASSQFAPMFKLDKEKLDILKQYSDVFDSMAEEFDGEAFRVEIDDITMAVSISLECDDVTIEDKTHKFYQLVQRSISFGFSITDEGLICMKLTFPSLWNRA